MVMRCILVLMLLLTLTACNLADNRENKEYLSTKMTNSGTMTTMANTATTPRVGGTPPLLTNSPPPGCDEAMILGVVRDFIAAFNRGDQEALARFFPTRGSDPDHPWTGDPDQLRWFTLVRADPSRNVDVLNLYTRETVLTYSAERHAQHEQIRAVELVMNPAGGAPGMAAINFRIARVADDLPETIFPGKGGVGCTHGRIFLWSQGGTLLGVAPARTASLRNATPVARRGTPTPEGATLSAQQAQEVATFGAFLRAYNAGDVEATPRNRGAGATATTHTASR